MRADWNKRNKALYVEYTKAVSSIPSSTTQCAKNICCWNVKVNVDLVNGLLKLIERQYKLSQEIRKRIPKYGTPGVPCTRSPEECRKERRNYENLLKWLMRKAKELKAQETMHTKEIPLVESKCDETFRAIIHQFD